jgi:hypothetical protein
MCNCFLLVLSGLRSKQGGPAEACFGNAAAARERAQPALKVSNDREVEYGGDWRWLSVGVYASADASWFARTSPSAAQ